MLTLSDFCPVPRTVMDVKTAEAMVNGGSNYDYLEVYKCIVI